jgi:hypothetical protein
MKNQPKARYVHRRTRWLQPLDPFLSEGVSKPEEVHGLAVAFDDICREMDLPMTGILFRATTAVELVACG